MPRRSCDSLLREPALDLHLLGLAELLAFVGVELVHVHLVVALRELLHHPSVGASKKSTQVFSRLRDVQHDVADLVQRLVLREALHGGVVLLLVSVSG
jgi:hypothetical protein